MIEIPQLNSNTLHVNLSEFSCIIEHVSLFGGFIHSLNDLSRSGRGKNRIVINFDLSDDSESIFIPVANWMVCSCRDKNCISAE